MTDEPTLDRGTRAVPDVAERRELEEAPQLVRKASVILLVGALFPWLTSLATQGHMPWKFWAIGMVLTLLAGGVLLESAKARAGLKANGLVKPIASAHPMAGTIVAVLLFIGAVVVAFMGASYFVDGEFLALQLSDEIPPGVQEKASNVFSFRAVMEFATLFLALATFAHVLNYEYGGKFNPVFPLMFLGPAIAGGLNTFGAVRELGEFPLAIVALIGSLIVCAGGVMAMYTMFVSMKQAKVEGDIKREKMREARKAERAQRREREQSKRREQEK